MSQSGKTTTKRQILRSASPRAWVGVVSSSHVERGVEGGFAQLCHGRHRPLSTMSVGDWLVYYSPKTELDGGAPLRSFTAIGRVVGEAPYPFDMGGGFVPFRRAIAYEQALRHVPVASIAHRLAFVRQHPSWGMLARRGHFEIDVADLAIIAHAMGVFVDPLVTSREHERPAETCGPCQAR
ncbi:MAG: EVE domain-containing protein [Polyangiaceae bacterium]|nr:EVE domain-containing protein [Polyangiaceae bacterium]